MDKSNDPVLIVGAGPSGLMMAHELLRYHIPCQIIEKDLVKSPYSRAIAVQIRTLEIFHALGLLDMLKEKAEEVQGIEIFAEDRPPITITLDNIGLSFDRLWIVDQPHTESVLERALSDGGSKITRGVELIDFRQNSDGVKARVCEQGHDRIIDCSYIIGADGAHSTVRKHMTNQFAGSTYDDAFILADAECRHAFSKHTVRLFFKEKNFLVLIPMYGKDHYRLIALRRGETQKEGPMPAIGEFQHLAQLLVPYPMEIINPVWVSRFFVQCRSASHYREGRAFLIGDAAHIHSPAGGQGMNTGLQDAFNLAWKLALDLKGYATPSLLDSYHDERKPVGDFLLDRTDRLFKFMVKSSLWARLLRRFILPHVAKSKVFRSRLITIGSQTAIRYEKGAICQEHHQIKFPSIKIGVRIPNFSLQNKSGNIYDLHKMINNMCVSLLFFFTPSHEDKLAAIARFFTKSETYFKPLVIFVKKPAERVLADHHHFYLIKPDLSSSFTEPWYAMVRPDHHVFCMEHLKNIDHALKNLKQLIKISLDSLYGP